MANWMTCEYYDASLDRSKPNNGLPINDEPVNLDYCYLLGENTFQKKISINWFFSF